MYPFSKEKFRTNKYRFLGLISAILNIKSENSDKIFKLNYQLIMYLIL